MKDEEMAEEYICNGKCQDDITRNYVHCKTCTRIKDFLAGFKAGRPQWHYLIEDPNDLPKKEGPYWVCVRDGRTKEDGSVEWTSKPLCQTAVWMDGVFCYAGGPPVIAWCELPVFDKE